MGGELALFKKTNQRGCWNLAAYHPRTSITWLWCLSFSLFRADEARVWPLFARFSIGQTKWFIRIPFVGFLTWASQTPMMSQYGAKRAIENALRKDPHHAD